MLGDVTVLNWLYKLNELLISSHSVDAILLLLWVNRVDENSVDPNQLASSEAS